MAIRTSYSFVGILLLAAACAHQVEPGDNESQDGDDDDSLDLGGTGGTGSTGSGGSLSLGASSSTGKSGSSGKGGSTALPPAGSIGGKGGKGGSGGGGSGGTSSGGTSSGGTGGGTVHMPVEGLAMEFNASSTSSDVDWLGGELLFSNESAETFALADLKIRYYFTSEIAGPTTSVNWSQFGPTNNMGNMTCSSEIVVMPTPKTGADSYVEITCAAGEMAADTRLKTSWKAGANGGGIFRLQQADDYSFAGVDHIVVLDGDSVIWGEEP